MKKFLSLVLALAMTMSLVTISAGAKDFADADKVTYTEAVDVMTAIGVIDGDAAGNVNPTAGLTRGAAAKIICNMILGPTTASALNADTAPYKDVAKDSTFAGYIAYCAKEGIISGYADGTFKPAAPLTGYAFMKMLLGALGYDVDVEGYTGANWSINVAKRALNIGLDDGLVNDFNGSDYVTREEAMLYAFNTLQAVMVEYDSKTNISIGDAEVVIAGSKAQEVYNGTSTDGKIDGKAKGDGKMQFAEKYFKDLSVNTNASDAFERPANTWKLKKAEIGTYVQTADLTYTASVELGTIYADLGLSDKMTFATATGADDTYVYYVDGEKETTSVGEISKGNDDDKIGGNGALTEVYYDADDNAAVVVTVNTYVGVVEAVEEATAKKDAYITIGFDDTSYTDILTKATFETESFEEDDVVLFTYSKKGTTDEGIQSVTLAETVTGEVSTVKVDKYFVVAGETYEYSAMKDNTLNKSAVETDVDFYLDTYGYAIKVDAASTSDEYAVVLAAKDESWEGGDYQVKLLFADGTVQIVDAKAYYDNLQDNIVTYTVSKGVYTLTAAGSVYTGNAALDIDNGKSAMKLNNDSTKVYGTAKTVFFFNNTDDEVTEAYVGVKNVPSVSATSGYKMAVVTNGSVVKAVYVTAAKDLKDGVSSDVASFFYARGDEKVIKDADLGEYFEVNSVVDGKPVVTKVATDLISTAGMWVASKVTMDENDIVTAATFETSSIDADGDGYIINDSIALVKAEDDVITIGGVAYTYSDDVVVYQYDISDDAFTAKTITSLKTTTSAKLAVQLDGNVIIAVYNVVA